MKRVDFFIVGAMRSGTSSLRDLLARNHRIGMAPGEPLFFSHDKVFRQGIEHYHSRFDWSRRRAVRGEKSPPYSVVPHTIDRVFNYNSDAKIIWILRDPAKRAVSHFQHARFRSPDAISLEEAIERKDELERERSTMAYVYRSEYCKHIERWMRRFPEQQHHVMIFEELVAATKQEVQRVHDFLGVPMPFGDRLSLPTPLARMRLPRSVNKQSKRSAAGHQPASGTMERLRRNLEPAVAEVEDLLGRPIPAWH